MARMTARPVLLSLALAAVGCGSRPAVEAVTPEYAPEGETKCSVQKSQDRPLIVEWSANNRAALESRLRQGVVPVHYVGCEMQVLTRCRTSVPYSYVGVTLESEQVQIEDEDSLYANLPFGAAKLESKLASKGRLDVRMTIAGRFEATEDRIEHEQLEGGDCRDATHAIVAVNIGAFELSAGGDTEVSGGLTVLDAGGGGKTRSRREELKKGGDPDHCSIASRNDTEPPEGCSALLRLEVVPIGKVRLPDPVCPTGSRWNGTQCVRTEVVTRLTCPEGTRLVGEACEPLVSRQCPSGTRYHEGHGCVAVGAPAPEPRDDEDEGIGTTGATFLGVGIVAVVVGGIGVLVWAANTAEADPEQIPPPDPPDGTIDSSPLRWEF